MSIDCAGTCDKPQCVLTMMRALAELDCSKTNHRISFLCCSHTCMPSRCFRPDIDFTRSCTLSTCISGRAHAATIEQTQSQERTAQNEQEETVREIVRGVSHGQLRQVWRSHDERGQRQLSSARERDLIRVWWSVCMRLRVLWWTNTEKLQPPPTRPRRIQTNRLP